VATRGREIPAFHRRRFPGIIDPNNKPNTSGTSRIMKRRTLILGALCAVVAGCGQREFTAPRNLDNACALADERPHYVRAMQRTERRWGVPVHVQMATFHRKAGWWAMPARPTATRST
jgi:hypothetical protein